MSTEKKESGFEWLTKPLEKLVNVNSLSGFEGKINDLFVELATDRGLEAWKGKKNAYARVGKYDENKPTIILSAHGDEIGMITTGITDTGFVRFTSWTGEEKVFPGLEVVIDGKEPVPGVITSKPPHLLAPDETKKTVPVKKLYVDTGLPIDRVKELISPGNPVLYKKRFHMLKNDRLAASAIDDKLCVALLLELGRKLSRTELNVNVVIACTAAEEVGGFGASSAFVEIKPDLAIAIDTTYGSQYDGSGVQYTEFAKGIALGRGYMLNDKIVENIEAAAKRINIEFQPDVYSYGTEADEFLDTELGCPIGVVSLPIRYLHQPIEVCDLETAKQCLLILQEYVTSLPSNLKEVL
ncbi:MAG TPA: M20/M25/M40 family metallo-hydrolase [Caldisericia bacterium]|nr:M20/M25/M40 family metallo-hydrolase [Caldisericia bacterium]HPF48109.1 M20/M25/M40 family metallo-hydrolase [Caldisericia bacterium]HPI83954.1 M20/M25/M40 family metallo-hydrolase [Caldisericia bacterium]HPQ92562.1 M20/M25/M40 family metallo-hydrolase [Caldisericia bacterium]HRV74340.1 M20/M25/M40 family metallo-hydrolase [Caldisericia bacterium]